MATVRAEVAAYEEIKALVLDASHRGRCSLEDDDEAERDAGELLAILAGIWEKYFG